MSDFDKHTLEKLEKLCRIPCEEDERVQIFQDLKLILEYVEKLSEKNTENVEPCSYVLGRTQRNIMREDEIAKTLSTVSFLKDAPDQIANMIKVPPILQNEDV